jgi:YbbR domain-containing protein
MTAAPTPRPTPPSGARRRVVSAFTERLGLKATALFLAVVLWFVVNNKQPQERYVPVNFTPVLDSSLVLRDTLPSLHATVVGAPEELIKLAGYGLTIRRTIAADAPDTVVLDLRPQDVTLPEGVNAIVQSVTPKSVTLRFESTSNRKVPVHSAIDIATAVPQGPIAPVFDPETVQVTGPRHLVMRVASVRTIRTTLSYPDSLPHLVDIDTTGLGPLRVKPQQVKVQLKPTPHR